MKHNDIVLDAPAQITLATVARYQEPGHIPAEHRLVAESHSGVVASEVESRIEQEIINPEISRHMVRRRFKTLAEAGLVALERSLETQYPVDPDVATLTDAGETFVADHQDELGISDGLGERIADLSSRLTYIEDTVENADETFEEFAGRIQALRSDVDSLQEDVDVITRYLEQEVNADLDALRQ
jgi:chromosome segregation ATPase